MLKLRLRGTMMTACVSAISQTIWRPKLCRARCSGSEARSTMSRWPCLRWSKPAHNIQHSSVQSCVPERLECAGFHSVPNSPPFNLCNERTFKSVKKRANYVDRVSNRMRWQQKKKKGRKWISKFCKQRGESGHIYRSIACNFSPLQKNSRGAMEWLFGSKKELLAETLHQMTGALVSKRPTEWQILKVKLSSKLLFSCFFLKNGLKTKACVLCDPLAFCSLTAEGGVTMGAHCLPPWPHSFLSIMTTACSAQPLRMRLRLLPLRRGIKRRGRGGEKKKYGKGRKKKSLHSVANYPLRPKSSVAAVYLPANHLKDQVNVTL